MSHTDYEFIEEFIPAHPFSSNDDNEVQVISLPTNVESDHVRVQVKTPHGLVVSENICNPKYCAYFKYGKPFAKTHLAAEKAYDQLTNKLTPKFQTMVLNQIERIADEMVAGHVLAYIVVEGWKLFYDALQIKLGNEFEIVYQAPQTNTGVIEDTKNCVGMIINTKKVNHDFICATTSYIKEGGVAGTQNITVPVVNFKDDTGKRVLTVAGVHVPGCATQYPKNGLNALVKILKPHQMNNEDVPMLIMGDFNAPPYAVNRDFTNKFNGYAKLLKLPYCTHINPNGMASQYDHAIVIEPPEAWYQLLINKEKFIVDPNLPPHAANLVNAIRNACLYKLKQAQAKKHWINVYSPEF